MLHNCSGPVLNFKEADSLTSKNGKRYIQVKYANPMGWDTGTNEMYQGNVVYEEYEVKNGAYINPKESTCTQMEFLELLISGANNR